MPKPARDIRSVLQEAMSLHQQGHAPRAEAMYREVLKIYPEEPNAWHLLGVAAWQRGNLATAENHIRKAIAFNDSAPAYHCNLGGVLRDKKDFAAAIEIYNRVLALDPANAEAKKGLTESLVQHGLALASAYLWDEAKIIYRQLLKLNPRDPAACNNLAQLLHHDGEQEEALRFYGRALNIDPGFDIARFNRAICLLGENRLAEGWDDLAGSTADWVPRMDERSTLPWFSLPLWDGSDLREKRILIWGDQGIGDEILYASILPDLIAQGAHVTIECAARLAPVFARSFPEISVIPRETPPLPPNDFDFHAPGLWLGCWLRQDFDDFPSRPAYLKADAQKTAMLRERYEKYGRAKIIGISWHSKTAGRGVNRRMDLRELVAALPRDAVYIDLQYGDTTAERENIQRECPDFLLHHDPDIDQLRDLDAFAAQVAACDEVVSIGNTTAHMAGALGVAGSILLPLAGLTWYWFRDHTECPWYPSLKLLRKKQEGSWDSVLAELAGMPETSPKISARNDATRKLHLQGTQFMKELKLEEAKTAYRRVLELEADTVATLNNLAMIAQHEGDWPAARTLYGRALEVDPGNLAIRYNRSLCSLTERRLEEGWADFAASEPHWRNLQDPRKDLPWMNRPLWDGSDLRGKKFLVWGDQGIGDEIVYISMVPDLLERGTKVTIECMDRLEPLFARSFPEAVVLPRQTPPLPGADFDFHATGMWLARHLRPNMDSFPRRKSFLKADAEKTAMLRERYRNFGRKRIVGISWFTASAPWGLKRSMPLPDVLAPLALEDMLIVDLQYGNTEEAWKEARRVFPALAAFHDPEVDQFKDMDMFAAQVAACDFVLTIGNTTSHVAGALGVPACILMPKEGLTWYWFERGADCPWYPSLILLRPDLPDRLKVTAGIVR